MDDDKPVSNQNADNNSGGSSTGEINPRTDHTTKLVDSTPVDTPTSESGAEANVDLRKSGGVMKVQGPEEPPAPPPTVDLGPSSDTDAKGGEED